MFTERRQIAKENTLSTGEENQTKQLIPLATFFNPNLFLNNFKQNHKQTILIF